VNEEPLAQWGLLRQKQTNKQGVLNVIRIYTLYGILHVETEQFWLKGLGSFINA
jgi:hypothetical protein